MKIKGRILLFAMLLAVCVTVLAACKYEIESPDYYFSVTSEDTTEESNEYFSNSSTEFSSLTGETEDSYVESSSDSLGESSVELSDSSIENSEEISVDSSADSSTDSSEEISFDSSIESSEEISFDSSIESSEEVSSESSIDSSEESALDSSEDSSEDSSSSNPSCGEQDHQQGDWVVGHVFITTSQQPTCLRSGYSRTFCMNCDLELDYQFYPELGHKRVTVPGFESTCCTHGATESVYCERCQWVLDDSEELPFSDHEYVEGCCMWCDLTELKFESVKREFQEAYAVCVGPVKNARRVVIPAKATIIDEEGRTYTYDVKEIKELAFARHHELYSVEIGENIEKIGGGAFDLCINLKEVYDKSKTQVTKGCDMVTVFGFNLTIKTEDIHYEAYESKISFSETGCIIYTDGEESTLIGCRNTHNKVIIPEGVTHIAAYVFEKCYYVTDVTIAASVQYIEKRAFYYECETHDDDVENHLSCKNPIKHVTFLNPYDWYVGEHLVFQDPIKMDADLSEPLEAWYQLVILRERYWIQEELFLNPTT